MKRIFVLGGILIGLAMGAVATAQTPMGAVDGVTWLAAQFNLWSATKADHVPNIAALRAYSPGAWTATGHAPPGFPGSIEVGGYYQDGDGGGNHFQWASASTATDDGCHVIKPAVASVGRWVLVPPATGVSVLACGAVGNGTTNDSAAVQTALDGGGTVVFPPGKTFYTGYASPIARTAGETVVGCGLYCISLRTAANPGAAASAASAVGNVLTVTTLTSGTFAVGQALTGPFYNGTYIVAQLSGTPGGVGTYQISQVANFTSTSISAGASVLTIAANNVSVIGGIGLAGQATAPGYRGADGLRVLEGLTGVYVEAAYATNTADNGIELCGSNGIYGVLQYYHVYTNGLYFYGGTIACDQNNIHHLFGVNSNVGGFAGGSGWDGADFDQYVTRLHVGEISINGNDVGIIDNTGVSGDIDIDSLQSSNSTFHGLVVQGTMKRVHIHSIKVYYPQVDGIVVDSGFDYSGSSCYSMNTIQVDEAVVYNAGRYSVWAGCSNGPSTISTVFANSGTSSVTVSTAAGFAVGNSISLIPPSAPIMWGVVTAVSGNVVSFSPALTASLAAGSGVHTEAATGGPVNVNFSALNLSNGSQSAAGTAPEMRFTSATNQWQVSSSKIVPSIAPYSFDFANAIGGTMTGTTVYAGTIGVGKYAQGAAQYLLNNTGFNPQGGLVTPSVPASGTAMTNPFPFPIMLTINGGSITNIQIGSTSTHLTTGASTTATVILGVGQSITLTYPSTAPVWQAFGQ